MPMKWESKYQWKPKSIAELQAGWKRQDPVTQWDKRPPYGFMENPRHWQVSVDSGHQASATMDLKASHDGENWADISDVPVSSFPEPRWDDVADRLAVLNKHKGN